MKQRLAAVVRSAALRIAENTNSVKITILPVCLLAFLLAFPARTFVVEAHAANITVNNATDTSSGGDGQCSLREALINANNDIQQSADCAGGSGADTVNFAASLAGQTITITSGVGQFSITSDMTINSLAAGLSVSGNNAVRVFNINSAAATVVMNGFRITGGNGSGTVGATIADGGAIQNIGNLTLNSMNIVNNTARSGGGVSTSGVGNRLTINGGSILGNTAASSGGGITGTDGSVINLTDVTVSGNTAAVSGGGIRVLGTLNITDGSVTGNTATAQVGGGISASGTVTITNGSITNNRADRGGGMDIGGSSTIINSTVSGNTTLRGGGGIFFVNGTHSITGTTFSANATGSGSISSIFRGGGGLANQAIVNISNSTVSGNSSGCDCGGGGISTFNGGTTALRNVTIANNTASAGPGGGIISAITGLSSGTINTGNTIVADNTATSNPDINGAIVSQGFNLVRARGSSTGYVATDLPNGSNPMLQALGNNGGSTQTHRLLAGSAAIDAGSNALAVDPANNAALITDQRGTGFARIVDGNGDLTATVDVGAFEAALAPTAATVSVSGRVLTAQGRGIRNVVIIMTDSSGSVRTTVSTTFGYYRFEEVAAGETYVFTARGKRFSFGQNTRVHSILEETTNVDFVADEQTVLRAK
jgi:CSLREA domain-containing protein